MTKITHALRVLCFALLSVFFVLLASCGKPRLFGKEMPIYPIVKEFSADPKLTFKAAREALAFRGYNIDKEDSKTGYIETHWQPTRSDSHYVVVFNRQDRGTVGAYHKLILQVGSQQKGSKVEIHSLSKSIISNLKSTGFEEEKVLDKIADFTRRGNIDVTNVGMQEDPAAR